MTNSKRWWRQVVLVACFVSAGATGWTMVSDVFRVNLTIHGVIQGGVFTNLVMNTVTISRNDLVNLAMGRQLGTTIPENEVLALTVSCFTNNNRLIVYDQTRSTVLATIAQANQVGKVVGVAKNKIKWQTISQLNILPVGNQLNGLTGGSLTLEGESEIVSNSCLKKFSGSMIGIMDTVVTGGNSLEFPGPAFQVLVSGTTLNTSGKKIGVLIEPD